MRVRDPQLGAVVPVASQVRGAQADLKDNLQNGGAAFGHHGPGVASQIRGAQADLKDNLLNGGAVSGHHGPGVASQIRGIQANLRDNLRNGGAAHGHHGPSVSSQIRGGRNRDRGSVLGQANAMAGLDAAGLNPLDDTGLTG